MQTRNYASNHSSRAVVPLRCCLRMFVGTMVSGNTDSLNYADNDGTCDHSWLTMLSGNAPLVSYFSKLVWKEASQQSLMVYQ